MKRFETQIGAGTPEQGRKEVPVEIAMETQLALLDRMIPAAIRPFLTEANDDPIREALAVRWMDKYVLHFNGFTEFCNENRSDREFMDRARQGRFTPTDYENMQQFLEGSAQGGPFFESGDEINGFLQQFVH